MEEIGLTNEEITIAVNNQIKKLGTRKSWMQNYLGLSYNTFESRLKRHNWKKVEIIALKQINVL